MLHRQHEAMDGGVVGRGTPLTRKGVVACLALSIPLVAALAMSGAVSAEPKVSNEGCFRCHAMHTFAQRAPTGEIENLSVTPGAFAQSEHHKLSCVKCHAASYRRFPHPVKAEKLNCLKCHKDNRERKALFTDIGTEFRRSVHFQKHPGEFTCFRCHDPHQFHRWKVVSRLSISEQNDVCLRCHASPGNYQRIAHRPVPSLTEAHAWLPHPGLHMQEVRCLDCHSSYQPPVKSHAILPKEQAVRDCVACHSRDTVLRQKLYRYQRGQETASRGFLNAALVNESYVIGATRNRFVDLAGLSLLGATLFGVSGFGLALRRARRRPRISEPEVGE